MTESEETDFENKLKLRQVDEYLNRGFKWLSLCGAKTLEIEIQAKMARNVSDLRKKGSAPYGRKEAVEEIFNLADRATRRPAALCLNLRDALMLLGQIK